MLKKSIDLYIESPYYTNMVILEKKIKGKSVYYYHTLYYKIMGSKTRNRITTYLGTDYKESNKLSTLENSLKMRFFPFLKYKNTRPFKTADLTYSTDTIDNCLTKNYFYQELMGKDENLKNLLLKTYFPILFIYNSNTMEGSKIPFDDFVKIANKKKTKYSNKDEIKAIISSFKAFSLLSRGFHFNHVGIKNLHRILMEGYDKDMMNYRNHDIIVGIGDNSTTHFPKIKDELSKLLQWYNKNKSKMFVPELAFKFYYEFERIHPFKDGNGRTGRMIMNKILIDNNFVPMIIYNIRGNKHGKAFNRSQKSENIFYILDFLFKHYELNFKLFYDRLYEMYKNSSRMSELESLSKYYDVNKE